MKDINLVKWLAASLAVISVLLSSCGRRVSDRHGIIGMEIRCDSLIMYRDREFSVVDDGIFRDVSVLLWIDSAMCSPCELERLANYESLNDCLEVIAGHEGRLKVVISLSAKTGIGLLINEIKYQNHSFDMFIDYKNRFPAMLHGNDRLLIVLKDGIVKGCFSMDNTDADIYRMERCLAFIKELYE